MLRLSPTMSMARIITVGAKAALRQNPQHSDLGGEEALGGPSEPGGQDRRQHPAVALWLIALQPECALHSASHAETLAPIEHDVVALQIRWLLSPQPLPTLTSWVHHEPHAPVPDAASAAVV